MSASAIQQRADTGASLRAVAESLRAVADQIDMLSANRTLPREVYALTASLVSVLKSLKPDITIEIIVMTVCENFGIPANRLLSDARTQHLAFIRQVAMYLCRELLPEGPDSFPNIGRYFGRDHSTVIHAHNLVRARVQHDAAFMQTIAALQHKIIGTGTTPAEEVAA